MMTLFNDAEYFCAYATRGKFHLNATATSVVEGSHAALKRSLNARASDLYHVTNNVLRYMTAGQYRIFTKHAHEQGRGWVELPPSLALVGSIFFCKRRNVTNNIDHLQVQGRISRHALRLMIVGPYAHARASMVQHKPLDRCKDVWEEDIDTGEMFKLPGLCLYTQSTGLPCKHVFDSLIRGVRVQPIKLHEIHSHWHLVHEKQLVEEAQAIGHYIPRIVTRETGELELRTRANIAPPIVNRYIPVDRDALPPRGEDDPTILDPMKAVHVGKEKKKKKNAVAPSYQQSHGLAETLARVDPPAAVDTPVAKTGRAYSRHENIINQERARTSSAPNTTDRAPVSCSVCGGPHNYRSPKCKQGLAIVQAEVLAGSARRAASQQSNNGRAMSTLSIERTPGTDVHERQGDLSVGVMLAPSTQPRRQG
jgi:hypothetical protein